MLSLLPIIFLQCNQILGGDKLSVMLNKLLLWTRIQSLLLDMITISDVLIRKQVYGNLLTILGQQITLVFTNKINFGVCFLMEKSVNTLVHLGFQNVQPVQML